MADSKKYGRTANLFDKDNATVYDCYVTSNGQWATGVGNKTVRISCDSNTQYTLSTASTYSAFRIMETNSDNIPSDGSPVSGTLIYYGSGNTYTFITSNTAKYIIFQSNSASLSQWLSELMFNTGSTALPYQPYLDWQHSLRKLGTSTDTITTLPADLYADGNNATVGLKGNMSQTGTPSPSNVIIPQECGERTINLIPFMNQSFSTGNGLTVTCRNGNLYFDGDYTNKEIYSSNPLWKTNFAFTLDAGDYTIKNSGVQSLGFELRNYDTDTKYSANFTLTETTKVYFGAYIYNKVYSNQQMLAQVNSGNTSLPYEPFGVKIPILSADTTTPVYLGEVQTTRQVKKLVLTGNEDTWEFHVASGMYRLTVNGYIRVLGVQIGLSTHFGGGYPIEAVPSTPTAGTFYFLVSSSGNNFVYFASDGQSTLADWKTYLQQQYANGTPVIVWYVLSSATTGIVNEPLRKIGDYADTVSGITIPTIAGKDTFDVLTTLKPSEVSLAYTGWHDATVKEWDGSEWQ